MGAVNASSAGARSSGKVACGEKSLTGMGGVGMAGHNSMSTVCKVSSMSRRVCCRATWPLT